MVRIEAQKCLTLVVLGHRIPNHCEEDSMRRSPIALALGLLFVMLTQRSALADGLLNPDPTDVQEAQGISADTTLKACVQNAGPNRNSTGVYGQFTDHQGLVRDLP